MLADLVHGGGCVAEGSASVNNPLARLSKAVLSGQQQSDIIGGTAAFHDPLASVGPSSSSGMLPEVGVAEAAFMRAFESGVPLQIAWEQAEAIAAASSSHAPGPGPAELARMHEAAWLQSTRAPPMAPPMAPQALAQVQQQAAAGQLVHDSLHFLASKVGTAAPAIDGMLAALPHLTAADRAMAARRADAIVSHLRRPGPMMNVSQSLMPSTTALSTGSTHAAGISPQVVQQLDAAHAAAWASLAPAGPLSAADAAARRSAAASAETTSGDLPSTSSELEAAYHATLREALNAHGAIQHSGAQHGAGSSASTAVGRGGDELFGGAFEQMEKVWRQLSLADGAAAAASGSAVDASDLDAIWQRLKGGDYESAWDDAWEGLGAHMNGLGLDDAADASYRFQEANPHLGGSELVARGTALFERGELREAVLVLEAAVQAQPEDTLAWQTLGQAHADADDDAQAIACLRRAVQADPHNLEALLSLGVSYTNELDQTRALQHLQLWLESHPDFAELGTSAAAPSSSDLRFGSHALHKRVTDLYLRAVEIAPQNADLHAVLGVLYNLSRSYPEATRAFERALELRPTDYSLWNKLGATQANAMSCGAALPCYIKALDLKPQYVRALSNLGISYGNLANYEAAAQCYLKALSLNREATHIWGYLTMTFTSMGRPDLVDKAAGADHELFRADFDF